MAVDIKNSAIEAALSSGAFNKLATSEKIADNVSLSWNIAKFQKFFDEAAGMYSEEKQKLIERFAEKDKEGKPKTIPIPGDTNRVRFSFTDANAELFTKSFQELLNLTSPLSHKLQLNVKDIPGGVLLPADFRALEGIMEIRE